MRYPISALPVLALWLRGAVGKYDAKLCDDGSYTSADGDFTYVPNAWNADSQGFSCIAVRDSPPTFDATWKWSSDPGSVHSYPHVKFTDPALPVAFANISALTLSVQWAMGPGSTPLSVPGLDSSGLAKLDASANAAFDIFADRNAASSQNETEAETEIMVWLGRVGYAEPLGYDDGDAFLAKVTAGHTEFTLHKGTNQRGTNVYTWAAESNETSFAAEISPLIQYLWWTGLVSAGSYLGLISFGTEGYHAEGNVSFAVSNYHGPVRGIVARYGLKNVRSISASSRSGKDSADILTRKKTPLPPQEGIMNEKADCLPSSDEDVERGHAAPVALAAAPEKGTAAAAGGFKKSGNLLRRSYEALRRTYCPREEPGLVLPTSPTDDEKLKYLSTNRIPLYVFGVFSFLTLSAGMWLFAISAPIFYWYGVFVAFLNIYLIISYFVGVVGRDWDYTTHQQIVQQYPINEDTAPTVDVYLPCCSEPLEILENTYQHIVKLDWPAAKLRVYVLDDGDQAAVRDLARSYGFEYIVRGDRPRLRKAGNLRWAFARTQGDFFAIFDADFCPRPDFLRELVVEHLADDRTAIVQSPQFFRVTDEQTWVEQGAGATQELFYRVVQVNRNRWGASICVGSNAVYRRAALVDVGGTAEIGFSEDVHTGFGAVDRGWKVKYVPLCLATGICPNTPRSFFSQQMRWARGSTTLLTTKHFWVSNLTLMQKICYLCGLLYYSAVSLGIFISPIPGTLLLSFRPEWFKYYNLAFAIPSIVYGSLVFRFWAKAKYGLNVQHVMVVQSYAYLTAIKDRLFGIELLWAASGDKKAHKSNKYRNMRILCWLWTIATVGGVVAIVTYRILTGFPWYHTIPLLVLNTYNLYITHYFLLCSWRW
ncbi:0a405a10-4426-4c9b-b3d3-717f39b25744 [Thermothielavioides terrestris]|uniref:0a405a10-4426-4c9b-b3d3-717f39b25744 n=1 Tax=Thermothielavioides terrestris TaxID=2587410 RepID=A0A3S4C6I2_9PEZI|nr:0a405a10-4426-4c9b-b3d3-717f39b25744 [Thermothielavioides terrestris]